MKTILHKADTRGHANHGWLDSHHTFSFSGYYDQGRVHFGMLRVLNDDIVKGGMGFGRHPHDNMEIISIPLRGELEHQDTSGGHGIIRSGEVQIMSAGSGIEHSEKNASETTDVNFLQKLMAYSLCRQLEGYDEIVVDHLMETVARDGYRMQTLISEIVTSYPFVNRSVREPLTASSNAK